MAKTFGGVAEMILYKAWSKDSEMKSRQDTIDRWLTNEGISTRVLEQVLECHRVFEK